MKVGTLIALMVEEGDDWKNVEIPAEAEKPAPSPAPAAAAAAPAASASTPAAAASHGGANLAGDG